MSDYYDHIIRCHLSLPALPRERFAKVAQSCSAKTAPVARPFAVGIARPPVKHVPPRGPDEGRTKTKWRNLCCPKSDESQKRAEAWELIWRSPDDGSGISKYCRWCERLRENTGESTSGLADTSARTSRASEGSSRRAPATVRSIKTPSRRLSLPNVAGGRVRGIIQPFAAARAQGKAYSEAVRGQRRHQMEQPFMSVFAAFVNGLTTETPGSTGLAEVEMAWLHEFRKKLTSALDVGRFLEVWNIRETHPKGNQCALSYDTGCARQIPLSQKMHRASTNWHTLYAKSFFIARESSRRAQHRRRTTSGNFRVNSSSAAREPVEENEIDICETDLAESMAIWGFGEEDEDHVVFQ